MQTSTPTARTAAGITEIHRPLNYSNHSDCTDQTATDCWGSCRARVFFFVHRPNGYRLLGILSCSRFLLRTHPSNSRRTKPLRKKDVRLWFKHQFISHDAPLAELLNKKAALNHTSSGDSVFSPVALAARLLHALRTLGFDAPLGYFVDDQGRIQSVSAADIRAAIRLRAVGDNLKSYGYDLQRIGSHSLRSSKAMRLELADYDDDIIKKLGRWTSNTYLHYIQIQIYNLTAGLARTWHGSCASTTLQPKLSLRPNTCFRNWLKLPKLQGFRWSPAAHVWVEAAFFTTSPFSRLMGGRAAGRA
jgi:hypothetical protein